MFKYPLVVTLEGEEQSLEVWDPSEYVQAVRDIAEQLNGGIYALTEPIEDEYLGMWQLEILMDQVREAKEEITDGIWKLAAVAQVLDVAGAIRDVVTSFQSSQLEVMGKYRSILSNGYEPSRIKAPKMEKP